MENAEFSRGYYHLHERYPKQYPNGDLVAELAFGLYADDGSANGEAIIGWQKVESDRRPMLYLEVCEDGWPMLAEVGPDLLPRLANMTVQRPTPEQVAMILEAAGFMDMTLDVWE